MGCCHIKEYETCPQCHGSGCDYDMYAGKYGKSFYAQIPSARCKNCKGSGKIYYKLTRRRKIKVEKFVESKNLSNLINFMILENG